MATEADTCRKFGVAKLQVAGWDNDPYSIAEQCTITDGRVVPVRRLFAALHTRFSAGRRPFNHTEGKDERYYQQIAINRTVEEILKGRQRLLLTVVTGTEKTLVAFQICRCRFKSGRPHQRCARSRAAGDGKKCPAAAAPVPRLTIVA